MKKLLTIIALLGACVAGMAQIRLSVHEGATGEVLKAAKVNAYNDFGKTPAVVPSTLKDIKKSGGVWRVTLPAASVAVLEIK